MRVLFVATPGAGHLFPMVPLARAFRAAGHQVVIGTGGGALELVEQAGLTAVDVVEPGFDWNATIARQRCDRPEAAAKMLRRRITELREMAGQFALLSTKLVDGTLALATRWHPDLIVQSQLQGAGYVAGAALDVPVVTHGFGFGRSAGVAEILSAQLGPLPARTVGIDVAPPSMVDRVDGWAVGFVPYNGAGPLPGWLAAPADRPRIAVTLGTVAGQFQGVDPLRRVVDLAPRLDAEIVLAVGSLDLAGLGPLPANVRPAGWAPLHALLPSCSALVHHGGAGTTLTALATGTPQLVLPTGSDRFINAGAVHRRGAGIMADPDDLDADLVREVAGSAGVRTAAEEVRGEIAALPRPAEVVSGLAALAATPALC
ncbi:nucleotide disphospho-sugar-binding domain-containing protein [Microlunatus ginsengisoli]|uniref:Glycosyltransferase n=1 Tax=Microlunatus ginsengisoli TaxID=363863 RepID=A0ABP7AH04_9ACTN